MHVLVIADQTLGGRSVFERIELLAETTASLEVYVVVPAISEAGAGDHAESGVAVSDEAARATVATRLEAALSTIRALGPQADGEVGSPDPLMAARAVLDTRDFDRILLATMPAGSSRWVRMDLLHRLQRVTDTLVEHIEAAPEAPTAGEAPAIWDSIEVATTGGPLEILLVEDNVADVELTKIALERSPIECEVAVAAHGREALDAMRADRPDLVLLDLAMPIMGGHEMLSEMRLDPELDDIPVVVLTTSTRDADRDKAHELGARAHIVKENDFTLFQEVLDGVLAESLATR